MLATIGIGDRTKEDDMEDFAADEWIARCAARIIEIDNGIAEDEAKKIAQEMLAFERTGAMAPEAAVDFVVSLYESPEPERLERRTTRRG